MSAFEARSVDELLNGECIRQRLRDLSIAELVRGRPTSVRLRNAIDRGEEKGEIPCPTVGDYVDAGSNVSILFRRRLWNFGQLTARELERLVRDRLAEVGITLEDLRAKPEKNSLLPNPPDATLDHIQDLTFAEVADGQIISTRLHNILVQPDIGGRKAAELLSDPKGVGGQLLRIPNFGRKSLHELLTLCRRAAIRRLADDSSDEMLPDDRSNLYGEIGAAAKDRPSDAFVAEVLADEPPKACSLAELIEWATCCLNERERDVLGRRYGLRGGAIQTLEEVGAKYCVTRERIRQIEAKALKKLRRRLPSNRLIEALTEQSKAFWRGDEIYFLGGDRTQLKERVAPIVFLALDVANWSSHDWLGAGAHSHVNGFLALHKNADEIRGIARDLEARLSDQPLPISLPEAAGHVSRQDAEAALRLETAYLVFEDYVVSRKPGPRLRRAIRLHAILAKLGKSASLYDLGDAFFSAVPEETCTLRDLSIVMELLPHLFSEIEEGYWFALGAPGNSALVGHENQTTRFIDVAAPDPITIAGSLYKAIRERGPSRIGDLYRDAKKILQPGRSPASITYLLTGRPELFRRILPSVYALPDQVPSESQILSEPPPYLLTESQARIYAHARRAGEDWGTFTLWSPASEYRLCEWSRFEASAPIFHSLLSVARIHDWPVSASVRHSWLQLAAEKGRFELPVGPAERDGEPRPYIDRLYCACRIALERGSMNWLLANRILGRRLDAWRGRGLLALMLGLGAVSAPDESCDDPWNLAHPVTDRAREIAAEIHDAMVRDGLIAWDSPLGERLARRALSADPDDLGWTSRDRLATLLDTDPATFSGDAAADDEDEDDLIARLRREHQRELERDRHEAIASLLLED